MAENSRHRVARLSAAAVLIVAGVAIAVGAIFVFPKPSHAPWAIGWILVAIGGALLPNRWAAGLIIAGGLAMQTPILAEAYREVTKDRSIIRCYK